MKPKIEIYAIQFRVVDDEGKQHTNLYTVGGEVSSYKGMPTKVQTIKSSFGLITISFEDDTELVMGYDPLTMDLFRRKVETKTDTE
jgi:hypothetical protein